MQTTEAATRSVVVERELPHPPEKVWRALTESNLMEQWFIRNNFEPTVGRKFQFRSDPMPQWNGIIDSEVLAIEPHHRLVYTWASMGLDSTVTWTLTPTAGGTHVRMEQSGFRPDQEHAYKGAQYGWNNFFAKLEKTLEGLG